MSRFSCPHFHEKKDADVGGTHWLSVRQTYWCPLFLHLHLPEGKTMIKKEHFKTRMVSLIKERVTYIYQGKIIGYCKNLGIRHSKKVM